MILIGLILALWVWLGVTALVATIFGQIASDNWEHPKAKARGRFFGFMLAMGGFFVYWAGEFVFVQYRVSTLCRTQSGLNIHLTPEQWREQIGEDEWKKTTPYFESISNFSPKNMVFNGREYSRGYKYNNRVAKYSVYEKLHKHITGYHVVYYDLKNQTPLFSFDEFRAGVPSFPLAMSGLKFWLDAVQDCSDKKSYTKIRAMQRQYGNYEVD